MPRMLKMKTGAELKANRRSVPFSFWPVAAKSARRSRVQSLLFASDPWVIMKDSIPKQVQDRESRKEALSYIDQAADFYKSALQSKIDAAKPVQLYYSYLNIVKAFILCRSKHNSLPGIRHGISESPPQSGKEFTDANIECWESPNKHGQIQVFDEFLQALGYSQLQHRFQIPIASLVPQILPGHRLWASAANKKERFLSLQRIQFTQDTSTKKVWLRFYLYHDDLSRLGHTPRDVLEQSGANKDFQIVKCTERIENRDLICFENTTPRSYIEHGVDVAESLAKDVKDRLWSTVASVSPYRRYYLYLCPPAAQPHLLPQLASIYALTFYLGSVTRYRPTFFRSILVGAYGPRISEFVSGQPAQFIYLMASEFAKRDVTQPSIV